MKMQEALFEASRDPQNLAARRPSWNDESCMVLHKGRGLMIIGNRPSPDCLPMLEDTSADDWYIVQR